MSQSTRNLNAWAIEQEIKLGWRYADGPHKGRLKAPKDWPKHDKPGQAALDDKDRSSHQGEAGGKSADPTDPRQ